MKKLRRVLVAIADVHRGHGSELRRAAALARATGAHIELFHAVTAPATRSRRIAKRRIDHELSPEESLSVAQKGLERIARSKLLHGCRVQAVAEWGKPAHEAIVHRAISTHADLIINGTRPRGRVDRLVLRHTDWELIRHSPVPLLLVKSARRAGKDVVLAAIDPLHANAKPARLDRRILDAAGAMAATLKGTLHAFHSYMPLSISVAAGVGEPVVWDASELDASHLQHVVREFARALRTSAIPPSRRHLRMGDVAAELAACARQLHASMVVMGAVSRSGLERLLIGNAAQRVLDELKCDVLIVK
jgi:universal stress protein E